MAYPFLPWWLMPPPVVPTIPPSAKAEHTYRVSGYLCQSGEESHSLSDDVYGNYTKQGLFNEYVVSVFGYGGYDYFRVGLSMLYSSPGDKIIIVLEDSAGKIIYTTVSFYSHVETPIFKLATGTYKIKIGFLRVAKVPAEYRINMG